MTSKRSSGRLPSKATARPAHAARRKRSGPPRVGLALAGGGPLGGVYEIGALAALEDSIEGLDLNDAAIYVGISAGALVAAALANGVTPHEMCRLFVESDADDGEAHLFKPEMLLQPAWSEFCVRAAALPVLLAGGLLHYARHNRRASLANSLERIKAALPTGILSGDGIHEFLQKSFSLDGRTNDFRRLRQRLVIVATDLDSGEAVRFGQRGFEHVPISRAAQASAAVPGLFPPVEIGGRYYVDGALRKTLHASIALDEGVDLLLCVNPIVPFNARSRHAPGKLAQGGLLSVLSQTLRAIIHSRVEIGMATYTHHYPDTDILLVEPSPEDADMFFTNLFSFNSRRRICENAYQNTRLMLWQRRSEIGPLLERHGLRLKLSVLRDSSLTLVKNTISERGDRFGLARLNDTLNTLERHLKIVAG